MVTGPLTFVRRRATLLQFGDFDALLSGIKNRHNPAKVVGQRRLKRHFMSRVRVDQSEQSRVECLAMQNWRLVLRPRTASQLGFGDLAVASVKSIANDWATKMGKMDSKLMRTTCLWLQTHL